jgi:UTP--glucose-1-phosphate uridylyltransferase
MIEKPQTKEEIMSLYSILGRCILPPEIFDILENIEPGAGGEIQLTDAMAQLARSEGMTAVEFSSKRYDMGNKLGILQANIEVGLKHKDTGDGLREYIKELAKTL